MPEGDTIHTLARRLGARVQGQCIRQVVLLGVPAVTLRQRRIERVRALGKYLLIETDGGPALHVHLGLTGSVHRYAPDSSWPLSRPGPVSLVLETDHDVIVGFGLRTARLARSPPSHLGPDLLDARWQDADWAATAQQHILDALVGGRTRHSADVLLDQRVAAGIGNVYKSELLFLHGLHPWRPVGLVPVSTWLAVYASARRLLCANLHGGPRTTVPEPRADPGRPGQLARLWVYGRAGRPCLQCAARLRRRSQGEHRRVTHWCPACQPDTSGWLPRVDGAARSQ